MKIMDGMAPQKNIELEEKKMESKYERTPKYTEQAQGKMLS